MQLIECLKDKVNKNMMGYFGLLMRRTGLLENTNLKKKIGGVAIM